MPQVSFWESETFFAPQDVIIVGSGFTGLWSALHLKSLRPKQKITILETGLIPTGASTRNAGFSCFGSPGELLGDADLMGEDKMWQLVEKRFKGLSVIRENFTDEEIGYDDCGGFECFNADSSDWQISSEKLHWLNKGLQRITGKENVFGIADEKLSAFGLKGFDHLIENKLEGGLHSGKLLMALLKKVQSIGVQVFTNVEVTGYTKNRSGIEVSINNKDEQLKLQTAQLLLCTNAFTHKIITGIEIIPNRGQVFITNPIPNLLLKGTFHFNKGFYYFRNVGNRLLIGGARNKAIEAENVDTMETTLFIQEELERFTQQHILPGIDFEISNRWSGIMGMGADKSPIVQQTESNVFCCVRMNGMGVALAPVVSAEIAQLMNK